MVSFASRILEGAIWGPSNGIRSHDFLQRRPLRLQLQGASLCLCTNANEVTQYKAILQKKISAEGFVATAEISTLAMLAFAASSWSAMAELEKTCTL